MTDDGTRAPDKRMRCRLGWHRWECVGPHTGRYPNGEEFAWTHACALCGHPWAYYPEPGVLWRRGDPWPPRAKPL